MDSSVINDDHILLEELEHKKQELHSAHQSIEILTRNVQHLEEENSELKNELEEWMKKFQSSKSGEQMKSDAIYRQQISDLHQCLEEAQTSEKLAKEEVKNLEKRLRNFLETAASCAPPSLGQDDELICELQAKLSQLEEEKICLKERLVEAALEHQKNVNELSALREEFKDKEEEIECLESQYTSQCNINEHLRDENLELKTKLETDDLQVVTSKKGNSLFSEVDDRRVIAETKIVKLESFLKKVEEQLTKEQKENKRLKQQILLLRQTSSSGYTEESVKSLLGEIAESKRQIIQLSESLHKKEVLVVHETKEFNLPSLDSVDDSDKLYIKYLQDIIQDKVKLLNAKVHEVQQSYLQLKRTEFHLAEAKKENVILVHERDKLKSLNAHLNISLQELQRKYEPKQFQPSLTEKVKIVDDEPEPLTLSNQNRNNISQAICLTEKCGDSRDVTRGAATGNDKENLSAIDCDNSQRSVKGKSLLLTMKSTSHSSDNKTVEHMTLDHSNKKPEMKYKNVTYQKVDEPSECKQQ